MHTTIRLFIVFLFVLPFATYSQSQDDYLIQTLYAKSGLQEFLEQIPVSIKASLELLDVFDQGLMAEGVKDVYPKEWISHIREQISGIREQALEAFAPQALKKPIIEEIKEKLSRDEIN